MCVPKGMDTMTSILGAQKTFGLYPTCSLCSVVEVAMEVDGSGSGISKALMYLMREVLFVLLFIKLLEVCNQWLTKFQGADLILIKC